MGRISTLYLLLACLFVSIRATAGELDVGSLAAKLAAQEAMLTDIEAKMAYAGAETRHAAADAVTSLRKNAAVTIGGLVTTGYYVGEGSYKEWDPATGGPWETRAKYRMSSLELSDAELYAQIDVNEHFDAFLYLDLHKVGNDAANNWGTAKAYYVRWKNICNTGFGVKIGRDRAAFGDSDAAVGYLDNMSMGGFGDGMSWWGVMEENYEDNGWFGYNGWKFNGVTQVTPYWEGLDGRLKIELSLFQNVWNDTGARMNGASADASWSSWDGGGKSRSRNYGAGSGSARIAYSPVEDLTFTAGVINFRSNRFANGAHYTDFFANAADVPLYPVGMKHAQNNTAVHLAFNYRPCFLKPLRLWGQWVHGWNVNNVKDVDSDVVNLGVSWDVGDSLTLFAQGDYVRTKSGNVGLTGGGNSHRYWYKGIGWASYVGAIYALPVGAVVEAGWRHESYRRTPRGDAAIVGMSKSKAYGDMFYVNVGFEF